MTIATRKTALGLALAGGLLLASRAAAADSVQLAGVGTVEYHLIHKFHKVVGASQALAVRGSVDAAGLKVMARAQVGTFDSGNSNRDQHMMEAVEGEKYPWVVVRAALPAFELPKTAGTSKITVEAAVDLHGVVVNHPIDIAIATKDGAHFTASFTFSESLTAHKIERPSLLFVAVDDLITIVGKADLVAKR